MVKITLKTITQKVMEKDVTGEETIAELKERIEKDEGAAEFPKEQIKLIFNGKVLEDTTKFDEIGYDEKKFIVVMVTRKPAAAAPAATPKVEDTTSTTNSVSTTGGGTTEGSADSTPAIQPPTPAAPAAQPTASAPSENLSSAQEDAVSAIVGMGYPRDQVIAALRAAFFNPERAVEFLINGIPDGVGGVGLNEEQLEEAIEGDDAGSGSRGKKRHGTAADAGSGVGGVEGGNPMDALRNLPQFEELRRMVTANPELLPTLLQQIAAVNPDLMRAIAANQADFLRALNTPAGGGGGQQGGPEEEGPRFEGIEPDGRQRISIPVTREERDAINRLKAMGFPEALVLEAFFACDKNEDLAVNYILQRMEEQDE